MGKAGQGRLETKSPNGILEETTLLLIQKTLSTTELIDALRSNSPPLLLGSQRNVCYGAGGTRNISDHGVGRETGKPWRINPDAALVSVLMIPIIMRSVYLYNTKGAQEF